ncbi:hypothetical protein I0P70_11605 [Pontibacter sp. FD36]|uniref:hypothetical protein n=1 Tax=Pontibacter sp. FD36 TaxID=2789860 RepID=UPI0018AC00F8|nr:hypothetical protein [Pontibacter sp. FD36]MBF8963896.1 hypothetical protein [Pontibacter sp. FD36]
MIQPIRRASIFRSSPFADNLIASYQRCYAAMFDATIPEEAKVLRQYYDHREALQPDDAPIVSDLVMAYEAAERPDYVTQLPLRLQHFFNSLGVAQLYLMDFLRSDLNEFPFENFRKKNLFRRMVGRHSEDYNFLLDTSDLPRLLPLFFHARKWDVPVIFLVAADGEIPIALNLCDDGNLHVSCPDRYSQQVQEAALAAGFETGDFTICSRYSVCYLKH